MDREDTVTIYNKDGSIITLKTEIKQSVPVDGVRTFTDDEIGDGLIMHSDGTGWSAQWMPPSLFGVRKNLELWDQILDAGQDKLYAPELDWIPDSTLPEDFYS